jgi:hypothetical protein
MIDDEPRLVDTGRGFTVRYHRRLLYPTDDPIGSARRRAAAARIAPRTLVFVPSLTLGYGLGELAAGLPPDSHVLCVEADQPLMALALDSGTPLPRLANLTVVRADRPERVAELLHELGVWRFRRVAVVSLSGGNLLHPHLYREMRATLEEEIRIHWQNRLTLMRMSRLWLKNLFANLALLPGASFLESLDASGPVVVAGAGPSLERALPWIQRLRSRVVLLAVDTALPVLADAGLEPDWVAALEAQTQNLQDFLPSLPRDASLLGEITACPQTLRLFTRRFLFSSRFYPLELFDRLAEHGLLPTPLPPRGSVGVTAVEAAMRVSRGPVLLAGLDFGYPGQQTHARGAPAHRAMLHSSRRLRPAGMRSFEAILGRPRLWLSGRGGGRVLSDLVLQQYALQLRRVIGDSQRVYDIGGLGLDCGARTVSGYPEAQRICARHDAQAPRAGPRAQSPQSASVLSFCRSEIALLEAAEREIERLLGEGSGAEGVPQTGSADQQLSAPLSVPLSRVEYVFLHLPVSEPRRRLTPSNLEGARAASRYYRGLLERTAAGAETLIPPRS